MGLGNQAFDLRFQIEVFLDFHSLLSPKIKGI